MANERDRSTASRITTDPGTVRSWGERHELVPVRRETDQGDRLDVVTESERRSDDEELSWSAFEDEIEAREQVVVRRGEGAAEEFDVVDRSAVAGPAAVDREDVAESLLEGEAVETAVTETTVVEHTIVEEATVESEIADREIVESTVVDLELLTTDVDHATVARTDPPDESAETVSRLQAGTPIDESYDVGITVDEGWTVTKEVVERITIESRIVETDVEDEETVATDTMRETVDVEGVTEAVLEGELVASPETARQAVESGHVESRFREDDRIETHLVRRQTIEEELSVRKEITGEVSDGETVSGETIMHSIVESEIVGTEEYGVDLATGGDTAATAGAAEADGAAGTETDTGEPIGRTAPTEEDKGKAVVDAGGDEVGMVADVTDGEMYVDPSPSVTDRIRSALGWSDRGEDAYRVEDDHVDRIEDDRVVLSTGRER